MGFGVHFGWYDDYIKEPHRSMRSTADLYGIKDPPNEFRDVSLRIHKELRLAVAPALLQFNGLYIQIGAEWI